MAYEVIMPKAGMAMETGKIIKWLKAQGDAVESGEPILEIETDKVSMEIESPYTGTLLKILYGEGEVLPVTTVIGYIGDSGEAMPAAVQTTKAQASEIEDTAAAKSQSTPVKTKSALPVYDVVVVGGGPAGYVAAIKAARLGANTALVEKSVVGGTCLNRGCIPTKTYLKTAELIEQIRRASQRGIAIVNAGLSVDMPKAVAEKNRVVRRLTSGVAALLKSSGVDVYHGEARIHPDKTVTAGGEVIKAEKVILAGGSKAAKLNLPGMELKRVMTSDEILDTDHVPESIAIIGGGVIGVEMAFVFSAFGSAVTIIELMDNVLPMMDADVSRTIRAVLESKGIKILTGTKLNKIEKTGRGIAVYTDKHQPVSAECALLSVGRVPDLSAAAELDIELERGCVRVDETMRSSVDWIYAPGDINGRLMLAHAAFKMGETAAENAAGHNNKVDLRYVPSCVYTMPEVGSVGMTEQQARQSHEVSIGMFPFCANGRALASGEGEGFVKVIAEKRYGEVLGVHIVGPAAAEIVNEAASLMAMECTVNEIAGIVHGHPTYAEAFMEAAADSIGECLHLPQKKQ